MRIDSSQIYSLIFRSPINSYSFLPQFHFMNIIPIEKYVNLTNNSPIHKLFFKVFMNILFFYWICIKSMNISDYGFVCPVNSSNEKYKSLEKEILRHFFERKKNISGICELFANTSHLTNIILIPQIFFSRYVCYTPQWSLVLHNNIF